MKTASKMHEPRVTIVEKADGSGKKDALQDTSIEGLLMGRLVQLAPTNPISEENKPLKFFIDDNTMADLWLAVARDE